MRFPIYPLFCIFLALAGWGRAQDIVLSPPGVYIGYLGAEYEVSIDVPGDAAWTLSNGNPSMVTQISPSSGAGDATISFTIAPKPDDLHFRSAAIRADSPGLTRAFVTFFQTREGTNVSPGSIDVPHEGGSYTVQVDRPGSDQDYTYSYGDEQSASWIAIDGATPPLNGPEEFQLIVAPNFGPRRDGEVKFDSRRVSIHQLGPCSVSLPDDVYEWVNDPYSKWDGESPMIEHTFSVTAPEGCQWAVWSTNPTVVLPEGECFYTGTQEITLGIDSESPWFYGAGNGIIQIGDVQLMLNLAVIETWCGASIQPIRMANFAGGRQTVDAGHYIAEEHYGTCFGFPGIEANAEWITIENYDRESLTYFLDQNLSPSCRKGTISFGDTVHTVIQFPSFPVRDALLFR